MARCLSVCVPIRSLDAVQITASDWAGDPSLLVHTAQLEEASERGLLSISLVSNKQQPFFSQQREELEHYQWTILWTWICEYNWSSACDRLPDRTESAADCGKLARHLLLDLMRLMILNLLYILLLRFEDFQWSWKLEESAWLGLMRLMNTPRLLFRKRGESPELLSRIVILACFLRLLFRLLFRLLCPPKMSKTMVSVRPLTGDHLDNENLSGPFLTNWLQCKVDLWNSIITSNFQKHVLFWLLRAMRGEVWRRSSVRIFY